MQDVDVESSMPNVEPTPRLVNDAGVILDIQAHIRRECEGDLAIIKNAHKMKNSPDTGQTPESVMYEPLVRFLSSPFSVPLLILS